MSKLLGEFFGRAFKKEALLLGGVLVIGGLGALGARAWGQGKLDAGVAEQIGPVKADVAAVKGEVGSLKADLAAIRSEVAAVRVDSAQTNAGVNILLKLYGLPPPPRDAG
ncbi:MAG: hypothetical protein RL409_28, partial [Gemmatimonadota bacterium]